MPATHEELPLQVSPPQFALSALSPSAINGVEVVALPVSTGTAETGESPVLGPGSDEIAESLGIDLLDVLGQTHQNDAMAAKAGTVTAIPLAATSPALLLLVGVGAENVDDFRRAGAAVARACVDRGSVATSIAAITDRDGFIAFVTGMMLGSYSFHWRSTGSQSQPVEKVVLADHVDAGDRDSDLQKAIALGGAAWRGRSLAWVPSNLKNPQWLADQANETADAGGLKCTVWDEKQLAKHAMGGILGVGRASASPPRLIRLDYNPSKSARNAPRVVLVGKGITFDSGGLSIKPADAMAPMKRDMTGGGVVIAVLGALKALGCPIRVTGLIAAAENAVSGDALRPGDVIRHYGGRTSEVMNTDAEGRLVLADALAYAVDKLDPAAIVDVATLTGAIKVSLGQTIGGFFANNDVLAQRLSGAGQAQGEPLWRMPLAAEYEERLASKVADADNAPGGPGAITAALFLQHFVGNVPWAHLDIASVGDSPTDRFEWSQGPTGFGVRLLLDWLTSPDPLAGVN